MQKQKGAKIGAFVFFCFGVMMLALGVWGLIFPYATFLLYFSANDMILTIPFRM